MEITYLKNQLENNQQKIETANIIIKLNEKQHNRILELEKKLEQMMNHESELLKQNEIKHENQFTNLKKKMMDHIKTAQKNMAQSNLDNLDLNTKLSKLTTNQLLIELEEQSTQIEELLKTKEKYEKEIFSLKTDMNTHKRVEQILQEKNKGKIVLIKLGAFYVATDKDAVLLHDKLNLKCNELEEKLAYTGYDSKTENYYINNLEAF